MFSGDYSVILLLLNEILIKIVDKVVWFLLYSSYMHNQSFDNQSCEKFI